MALLAAIARDIAELVRAGYPEETARRIATGELPMDTASRMERARQLGYDPDDVQYHGTSDDILAFRDTLLAQRDPGYVGRGVYTTSEPRLASSYANMAVPRERNAAGDFSGPNVMPLLTRGDEFQQFSLQDKINLAEEIRRNPLAANALTEQLSDAGKAGAEVRDNTGALIERVTFDPRNVRSLFSAAFDPEYTGPNILGASAATAGALGLLAAPEEAEAGFITRGGRGLLEAWHGSPHKFDKFSMDQIGTGEGAQAYGHGLYFADSKDVATGYRNRLSGNSGSMYGDLDIKWDGQEVPEAHREAASYLNDPLVMGEAKTNDAAGLAGVLENIPGYEDSAKWLRDNSDKITATPSGHLYRVEVDVTPESLLDWDKPLSEQSEAVQKAVSDLGYGAGDNNFRITQADNGSYRIIDNDGNVVQRFYKGEFARKQAEDALYDLGVADSGGFGRDIYEAMKFNIGREEASSALSDRGIKGIKYLDGDSRAVGDGTSNYVIFDDSLINIAERGAADPRLLGGTALGTAGILGAIAAGDRDDTAMAASPRSDTLQGITMGLRDVERRLKGSPASLLFPEGVVNYLETVNRPYEDPTALTRAMALLDFL
jgi:hypothetical protein